jgi:hypothetical protein
MFMVLSRSFQSGIFCLSAQHDRAGFPGQVGLAIVGLAIAPAKPHRGGASAGKALIFRRPRLASGARDLDLLRFPQYIPATCCRPAENADIRRGPEKSPEQSSLLAGSSFRKEGWAKAGCSVFLKQ